MCRAHTNLPPYYKTPNGSLAASSTHLRAKTKHDAAINNHNLRNISAKNDTTEAWLTHQCAWNQQLKRSFNAEISESTRITQQENINDPANVRHCRQRYVALLRNSTQTESEDLFSQGWRSLVYIDEQQKIEAARTALRLAAERPSDKRKTPKAKLVAELRHEIATMKLQGWTWEAIAEALRGTIDASPDTIRRGVGAGKKKSKIVSKPKAEDPQQRPDILHGKRASVPSSDKSLTKPFGPPEL